jgi:2-phospho-L-lactate guanylyltransferase
MAAIVVPFRGSGAKLRLAPLEDSDRAELARAMLGDVLAACVVVAPTSVVTDDALARPLAHEFGADALDDVGGGQGAAVRAGLDRVRSRPVLVVNADVPCAVPFELRTFLGAIPEGGLALVEADDGTTNALGLDDPALFAPLYGPGSANRFRKHAAGLGRDAIVAAVPSLAADVDTLDDLRRLRFRVGPRTLAAMSMLGLVA